MAGSRIRPRVEARDGEALFVAAHAGRVESIAELLAEWPAAMETEAHLQFIEEIESRYL
jgi:hypothetical protein